MLKLSKKMVEINSTKQTKYWIEYWSYSDTYTLYERFDYEREISSQFGKIIILESNTMYTEANLYWLDNKYGIRSSCYSNEEKGMKKMHEKFRELVEVKTGMKYESLPMYDSWVWRWKNVAPGTEGIIQR